MEYKLICPKRKKNLRNLFFLSLSVNFYVLHILSFFFTHIYLYTSDIIGGNSNKKETKEHIHLSCDFFLSLSLSHFTHFQICKYKSLILSVAFCLILWLCKKMFFTIFSSISLSSRLRNRTEQIYDHKKPCRQQ
jgi:hypothetical protein